MPRSSSKDQDASSSASSVSASSAEDEEGTAAQSTTTADRSSAEQQAGPLEPSGTTAPSALTSADVPGPSDITIPKGGLEAMRERLGADLNEYGAELARRVLGELHIHRSGGVAASQIALEGADQLESPDAAWWNEKGQELAQKDFVGLNQRGSFSAPLPAEPAPPPSAEQAPAGGGQTQDQGAAASSFAPQTGPGASGGPPAEPGPEQAAPADQRAAP